jgi:hypothetical protein
MQRRISLRNKKATLLKVILPQYRPEGNNHLEDLRVDKKIILKRTFKKWDWKELTGLIWLMIGIGGGRL